jgi:hypothetical protein
MQGSGVLCTLLQRYVARLDERGFLAAGNYIQCSGSEIIFFRSGSDFPRLFRIQIQIRILFQILHESFLISLT